MNVYENLDVCKACGGRCCQRMSCHYSPEDFPNLSFEALKEEIEKGSITIDWWYGDIDTAENKYDEVYFLRVRSKGAKIIDPSWGGVPCSLWDKEIGCPLPFEKRPKGARALIPDAYGKCIDEYTKEMGVWDWRPYHSLLEKLREHFSTREDYYNL